MANKGKQFCLLLWKNYILQKRKIAVTLLEVGLPTFFALILIFIRQRVIATEIQNATVWPPYSVDKLPGGFLPPGGGDWKMVFTPDIPLTNNIMKKVQTRLHLSGIQGLESEEAMVETLLSSNSTDLLGGIVFTNIVSGKMSSNITYKIRLSSRPKNAGHHNPFAGNPFSKDSRWYTEFEFPLQQRVGPREKSRKWGGTPGYMREGFLPLQYSVDRAIIQHLSPNATTDQISVQLQRFPYPHYNDDNFVLVLQKQFPLLLMLSFVFTALHIVKDVVHEKERKLKESMKMMGLSNWLHWLAWFVKSFFFLIISVSIMTLFFCIPVGKYGSVVGYTSPSVLLVFLLAYSVATINFCFAVSVFFSKANAAAAAGGILFFVTYIPYFFLQMRYDRLSWATKIGCCLISNVAMAFGGRVIGMAEGAGAGVQWSNIGQGVTVDDNFTLAQVILMLGLDSVLYALIAWYVEAVRPGDYGIPQPWYFPFTKTYWCGTNPNYEMDIDMMDEDTPLLNTNSNAKFSLDSFEKEPVGITAGVKIKNLTKEFGKGNNKKTAVESMRLNMFEGQITALLGHNGAGKTTTMSMLTGFIPPTSGTAIVNGYDILKDIGHVRESLGLCPQHDVLFDTLTVQEHLVFFAKLKGCSGKKVQEEVDRFLYAIGLPDKRNALAKTLSGGMKRKLSVAIALIGGSKIVILDEPTSGMDPDARRHTWDILQQHREGRTMLLTTHFMDEADLLGDRIAIMANGIVQCCGSSLFLKNKYGAGYHMTIVKAADCNVDLIDQVVHEHVPNARMENNISAELSYILPHESSESFETLFMQLENRRDELNISSYGASVTTMEEVFLKVGEQSDQTFPKSTNEAARHAEGVVSTPALESFMKDPGRCSGSMLILHQFLAMFVKRVLHTRRNLLLTASQLIIPLFFTIMGLITIKTLPGPRNSPALLLNWNNFGETYIPYAHNLNSSNSTNKLVFTYGEVFNSSYAQGLYLNKIPEYAKNPNVTNFILKIGNNSLAQYTSKYPIAAIFNDNHLRGIGTKVIALFNDQAYHTPAVSLSAVNNALLQYFTTKQFTLNTINHPLPRSVEDEVQDDLTLDFMGFTVAFNVMFGMSFLASSFLLFIIRERAIKAKHCQFVSGAGIITFWASTFCWDFLNYCIPCVLLMITFAGFNIEAYIGGGRWGYILLLLLLYGWAILPAMYLVSFIFQTPSTGFVWITMLNILAGVATVLAVNILSIPQLGTQAIGIALEWVFLAIMPNFCLGQGLQDFYLNYKFLNVCDTTNIQDLCHWMEILHVNQTFSCCKGHCGDNCANFQENYLSWESKGIGRMVIFLAAQSLVYFSLVLIIESNIPRRIFYFFKRVCMSQTRYHKPERISDDAVVQDGDVTKERERILNTPVSKLLDTDALLMNNLTKYYEELLAVDHISVGIPRGECFGLLGVNGAGKTSTFKMLTGDETISDGSAILDGFDVRKDLKMVQQRIGYCPQFDALIQQLTGRETLYMYACLRGIPWSSIRGHVNSLLEVLLLTEHADKLVEDYSGGNKRKLSAAVALVGNPPIVFLDEPSTGMDPVARRHLWDALCQVRASGRTLILTSHSMEECEALCTKMAIMVNGEFKCLGTTQHLKAKFGEGYTLIAKIKFPADGTQPNMTPLKNFIEETFPGSILKDIHQGMVHYHIAKKDVSWSQIFGIIEKNKERYDVEDYSVSQTTLEQVFLNFARAQTPPIEEMPTCSCCAFCSLFNCCRKDRELTNRSAIQC